MMIIPKTFLIFIIASIPIVFAAVQPWVWSIYTCLMIVVFLILLWVDQFRAIPELGLGNNLAVALFFILTLLWSIPLPADIVSYLSPVRFQTFSKAQTLLNASSGLPALSYAPMVSFSWWVFLASLFLLFISVRSLCVDAKFLKQMVSVMIGIAILEAVYGLIQTLIPTLAVLWAAHVQAYMGDARGTFINRNHFAGFIGMVWPLALGFIMAHDVWPQNHKMKEILASDRLDKLALQALGIVALLLGLIFSRSRAGIAAASIGLLTFIVLTRSGSNGKSRLRWLVMFAIAGVLIVYSVTIGIYSIADRFLKLGEFSSRLDYWRDSLPILQDHPFGIGLRNFDNVFPVYKVSTLTDKRLEYAHNDYLQLLIEAGWIGSIALLSGFLTFMWKSARNIKHLNSRKNPMRFFLAVGAFSGLVSMAFHSFFDFNLQIPANCVYFVTLMAILYSCAWPSTIYVELESKNADKLATDPHRDRHRIFRRGNRRLKLSSYPSGKKKIKNGSN